MLSAVMVTQIWSTAATTEAGNRGASGTRRAMWSDPSLLPSEHHMSGSMASPYPGSAPPWRHGRTCENTSGNDECEEKG